MFPFLHVHIIIFNYCNLFCILDIFIFLNFWLPDGHWGYFEFVIYEHYSNLHISLHTDVIIFKELLGLECGSTWWVRLLSQRLLPLPGAVDFSLCSSMFGWASCSGRFSVRSDLWVALLMIFKTQHMICRTLFSLSDETRDIPGREKTTWERAAAHL